MAVSTIYEGKPTEQALSLDIRNEITKSSFKDVNGNSLTMDQLFSGRVSVVVFLRSLGWPLCQEHLLQYSRKREDLLANGIDLIMISIGKPEVGKELIAHLELQDGEKYIFVGKYMPVHVSFLCYHAIDNVPP